MRLCLISYGKDLFMYRLQLRDYGKEKISIMVFVLVLQMDSPLRHAVHQQT